MKLYFAPRSRAVRPRWLLEELGQPYELVRLNTSQQENRSPEYLAVHPLGDVPALVDGDVTLLESLAICLHLADRFPEGRMAPPVGSPERGPYYQWMVFAEVTLDALVMEQLGRADSGDALGQPPARLVGVLETLSSGLGGRDFLVGSTFTAADVVTASILHLAHRLHLLDGHPRLVEYTLRHAQRPAVRRALLG